MSKCEATWSHLKRDVALTKTSKMSVVCGRSTPLQHDLPRYLNQPTRRRMRGRPSSGQQKRSPSSKRRKRSHSICNEEGASCEHPRSFTKVLLSKSAIYTAECCRLSLPAGFFRNHNVESCVTMTDSTGLKLWHMRFQHWSFFSQRRMYIISNGWREFSYDHSLKVDDTHVFTLVSSHFVVEFATSKGSTRAMFPTRDGKHYPWFINYSRLDCLASVNYSVDSAKDQLQAKKVKHIRQKAQSVKEKPIRKKAQAVKEKPVRKKAHAVKEKPIRKKAQAVKEKPVRKKAQAVKEKPIRKKPHVVKKREIRQKVASVILPEKQNLQREMFCQCNTVKVGNGMNITTNARKECVFPEFTYLECKNPDGSPYFQILDSDSEICGVNED